MFKNVRREAGTVNRYRYSRLQSRCIYQLEEGAFLPCQIWEKRFYYVCIGERKGYLTAFCFVLKT